MGKVSRAASAPDPFLIIKICPCHVQKKKKKKKNDNQ
jgi:hypothetical protein